MQAQSGGFGFVGAVLGAKVFELLVSKVTWLGSEVRCAALLLGFVLACLG